jgi:peptidoglycan/LPS O-acetylase OafA/YrhL
MYLYHPICLMATATALAALSHRLADAAERSAPGSAAFLVGTVWVTIAAASVSYALLERPLLGLKRHFTPPAPRS